MTDLNTVPLRGQTETADRERSVIPLHGNPMPADPVQILARQHKDTKSGRGRMILVIGGGLLAAQMFAPMPFKPTVLVGQAAASFSLPTMQGSAGVQEDLARKRLLAERQADLEARWSEARAKCFWGVLLSPEAGEMCTQLVDANFVPAIQQIQRQLNQ